MHGVIIEWIFSYFKTKINIQMNIELREYLQAI